jgi:DNA-binding protein Fis
MQRSVARLRAETHPDQEQAEGNRLFRTRAAEILGISRQTLVTRLKEYGAG